MQLSLERRSGPRFQLTLPVFVRWTEGSSEQVQVGYCRNISICGVLVAACTCPPLGQVAEVELILSDEPERRNVRVLCQGAVVRVEDKRTNSELEVFAISGQVREEMLSTLSRDRSPRRLTGEGTTTIDFDCSHYLGEAASGSEATILNYQDAKELWLV